VRQTEARTIQQGSDLPPQHAASVALWTTLALLSGLRQHRLLENRRGVEIKYGG